MKVAITLGTVRSDRWEEVTLEADRLGFESVWMPEHLVLPVAGTGSPYDGSDHPPVPPDIPLFDAIAYLAYLAGRTEHVRFGTHVFNIGLRHPFVTARGVATLDLVSGGRVEFGVGASWLEAEWAAMGLDFAGRGGRVDEALDICLRLWSQEGEIEHHGSHFDFGPLLFVPKPVQRPHPPVHVGGDSPAALRRAARHGDGWIPMNHTVDQIPAAAVRLAELRKAAGRTDPVEITMGAPSVDLEGIRRCAEAGVGRVMVRPWRRGAEAIEGMRRFAEEVLPEAAELPVADFR